MDRDPALPTLGSHIHERGVDFAVWAPAAEAVEVHHDGGVLELESTGEFHRGTLVGAAEGLAYQLRAHGPWDPRHGLRFNSAKALIDPYALAITGPVGYGPALSVTSPGTADGPDPLDSGTVVPDSLVVLPPVRPGATRPDGSTRPDHPHLDWADAVVYEMHLKGYTAVNPDVPEQIRGTYAGLAHPRAIQHLVDLGVTSVELLPVQHFVSEPALAERGLVNHWGYNTIGFFAPHEAYASHGGGGQVGEFVAMVDALHGAGLEVLLDVVYNHTAEAGPDGPTLSMRGLADARYYKQSDGRYADTTGCGNSVDAGDLGALRLVLDSLRYWYTIMGVDGFRFDLAATLMRTGTDPSDRASFLALIAQDPLLRNAKLIAEPWDIGYAGYQVGRFPQPWAEWNDKYRDTVRDFWRGPHAAVAPADLGRRITGSQDIFPLRSPQASVNFITAHDGFTLHDLVSYDEKRNEANGEDNRDGTSDNRSWNHGAEGATDDMAIIDARGLTMRAMLATLCLSLGVPMITMGDEVARTQGGNNNAYCQDNEIAWMDWAFTDAQVAQYDLVRRLIAFRRSNRAFRYERFIDGDTAELVWHRADGTPLSAEDWGRAETAVVVVTFRDVQERRDFALALNASARAVEVALPDGRPYERIIDSSCAPLSYGHGHGSSTVEARSVVVFTRGQLTEE